MEMVSKNLLREGKIVFLEVEEKDRRAIEEAFPDAAIFTRTLSEEEIIRECRAAEALSVFIYSTVTRRVIEGLPNLKLIATRSVGYDHIDLAAARDRGVSVCNVPDYGSHVIAEHVFALLLSSLRCVVEGESRTNKCEFDFQGLRGKTLKGKTMGIVGTGKIGKNVARIASLGFLMDVIAADPNPDLDAARENHFRYAPLEEVLSQSDIISLHCPLLPETHHLINGDTITTMREGVTIINTSRGGVIDTPALVAGLKSGRVAHAALDVLEHEKNIEENREIQTMPNVLITPHIAFYADDAMNRMYQETFASIRTFLEGGVPEHIVRGV